jgi:hypothetical protein
MQAVETSEAPRSSVAAKPIEARRSSAAAGQRPPANAVTCNGKPLPDGFEGTPTGAIDFETPISIEHPEADLATVDAKTVILSGDAIVIIDYPIARPWAFDVKPPPGGFTRAGLVREIAKLHRCIYDEEARTTNAAVGRAGKLLNRNRTDGTFAICCHDIGDLVLERLVLERGPDGRDYVHVLTGS